MTFGGEKLPEKLTRTILQYPTMILKLHVKLKNDMGMFHNEFSYGHNKYINIIANGYITLEVGKTKDKQDYDPTRSFMIGVGNIGNVVNGLKKVLNNICKHDIFAIQNKKIIAYDDMVKKYTEQIITPFINQALLVKPSVIYDENEISYEGVIIYVNNTNNMIQLSISEFENFVYVLEKIDIFSTSQLLLNYYMMSIICKDKMTNNKKPNTQFKNIDWETDTKMITTSNYNKNESDDIFKDL